MTDQIPPPDNNGSQSFGFDNDSALLEDLDPGFTSKSLLYAIVPSEVNPILSSPPTDSDCVVTPDTLSSPIYDIYKEVLKVGAKNKNLAKQAALGIEARDHDLEEKCKKMEQRIRADAKEAVQSLQDDIIEMKRRLEISEKENKALRDRVNELEANKHDVENFLTSRGELFLSLLLPMLTTFPGSILLGLDTPVDHIIIKLRNLLDQA